MRKTCTIDGCEKISKAQGYCNTHYQQWLRSGFPIASETAFDWLKKNAKSQSGCVEWPYSIRQNGYGQLHFQGKNALAHRVSCEIFNGPPPEKWLQAAHYCGNRKCVNPAHLRWATPLENAYDRVAHGTHRDSERAPAAKLTNLQAAKVRNADGKQREIAAQFGVSQKSVQLIKAGKTYRAALGMN